MPITFLAVALHKVTDKRIDLSGITVLQGMGMLAIFCPRQNIFVRRPYRVRTVECSTDIKKLHVNSQKLVRLRLSVAVVGMKQHLLVTANSSMGQFRFRPECKRERDLVTPPHQTKGPPHCSIRFPTIASNDVRDEDIIDIESDQAHDERADVKWDVHAKSRNEGAKLGQEDVPGMLQRPAERTGLYNMFQEPKAQAETGLNNRNGGLYICNNFVSHLVFERGNTMLWVLPDYGRFSRELADP